MRPAEQGFDNSSHWMLGMLALSAWSGCAALIHGVVWFQLLQRVAGSSALNLSLLLGIYIGGLGLGSVAFQRMISTRFHPLRFYALCELGIGVLGLLLWVAIPYLGTARLLSGGIICALCLLPPTLLMGARLQAVSGTGFLSGAHIVGAALGCLVSGFYLLRVYDLGTAAYVAVGINIGVALLGYALATRIVYNAPVPDHPFPEPGVSFTYAAVALSGLCVMGAQVVWTRLLALMLGATVYTFFILPTVFLAGLGSGTCVGSLIARRTLRPRLALGICHAFLTPTVAWAAYMIASSLPYWPIDPLLALSPRFNFHVDLLRAIWTIFPATICWGASFALAGAALSSPARTLAVSTAGAAVGVVAFGIVLTPWLGTLRSQQLLIALSAVTGAIILLQIGRKGLGWLAVSASLTFVLAWNVVEVPWQVLAYGRRTMTVIRSAQLNSQAASPVEVLYRAEGMNSSILITNESGHRVVYIDGKSQASSTPDDMRIQRMAGHLPALFHARPQSVMIVGFGSGVTAGAFVVHPEVEKITVLEPESLLPAAASLFFSQENNGVLDDARTTVVHDDARHYLTMTGAKFDVIASDMSRLWAPNASTIYSREYFELLKGRLNPGGVVAYWVPLFDTDVSTVKTALATFFEAFPAATLWSNNMAGQGYDLILLGKTDGTSIDVDEIQKRLDQPEYFRMTDSLRAVQFNSAVDIIATYAGQASDLRPWLEGSRISLDLNSRLLYLAGMGLNSVEYPQVYREILSYRKFPD